MKELFTILGSPTFPFSSNSHVVISLILLAEYKESSPEIALAIWEDMKQSKMPKTDTIYKNFLLIALKFNHHELMEQVVDCLTAKRDADFPIPPGMFAAIMSIITSHKRIKQLSASNNALTRLVAFGTIPPIHPLPPFLYYFHQQDTDILTPPLPLPPWKLKPKPKMDKSVTRERNQVKFKEGEQQALEQQQLELQQVELRQVEHDKIDALWLLNRDLPFSFGLRLYDSPYLSRNRPSIRLSIQILQDRLQKKQSASLEVWEMVLKNALDCDDPDSHVAHLFGLIQRHYRPPYHPKPKDYASAKYLRLVRLFYSTLFNSHQWRLVNLFLQLDQQAHSSARLHLIRDWLPERAEKRNSGSIYTAFYHIFPRFMDDTVLIKCFIRALQKCDSANGLHAVWKLIQHYNSDNHVLYWSYLKALLNIRRYNDAITRATTECPEWFKRDRGIYVPKVLELFKKMRLGVGRERRVASYWLIS